MPLTDKAIRAVKAGAKPVKIFDGGGLHLLVTPAGGKLWRLKYRVAGKEQQLAIGRYPDISLADARIARDEAKATLRAGQNPGTAKWLGGRLGGHQRAAETFEALARDWHARNRPKWTERHAADVLGSLERLVFPAIGALHVNAVTPPLVLAVVRQIEQNHGVETARRVRQRMSATFTYALATGVGQTDPAAIVKGAMAPLVRGRMPAVTTLDAARDVLARAEAILNVHPVTRAAHRYIALTLARTGNVRAARWEQLDLLAETPIWSIPAGEMKMRQPHIVPLPRQAVELLHAIRPLTGTSPFIFSSVRAFQQPMAENAMGYLLMRAGLATVHTAHGWRATFSSVMNELYPADADAIERILAHVQRGVRGAYNRAAYLDRRRELLAEWADMLLAGAPSAAELVRGPRRPTNVYNAHAGS